MEVKLFFQSYSFINYIILIYCGLTIPIMYKNIPDHETIFMWSTTWIAVGEQKWLANNEYF